MKRRLVIQLARMGDVVQSLPLLERIKRLHPEDAVTLLIDSPLVPLFQNLSGIDEVYGFPMEDAWQTARQSDVPPQFSWWQTILRPLLEQSFDQMTVLNYSRLAVVMGDLFQATERTGYTLSANREYIQKPPSMNLLFASIQHRPFARWHLSDLYCDLESDFPPGIRGEKAKGDSRLIQWQLPPKSPTNSNVKKIGLIIGAGDSKRLLSIEFYEELIQSILKVDSVSILLIGSESDQERQQQILTSLDTKFRNRVIPTAGKTPLAELPDLLGTCDLVVGPDTGSLHLAAWCNIPTLGMYFSSASVHQTGPYGQNCHLIDVALPCRPCKEDDPCPRNQCQKVLSPEVVSNAILQILKNDSLEIDSLLGLSPESLSHRTTHFDPWGITFPSDNSSEPDLHLGWQRELFGHLLFPEQGIATPDIGISNDIKKQFIDICHGKLISDTNESFTILQDFLNLEDQENRPETRERILEILGEYTPIGKISQRQAIPTSPRWSIIIPVHNQSHLTRKCLDAITQTADFKDIEILIVDNGSTDDTTQMIDNLPKPVHRISMGHNQGFAAACNRGTREARSEWLFFLNNDTEVQPGWFEALNQAIENYGPKNILGAKLLYPDGRIQHAGVAFDDQGMPIHVGKGNSGTDHDFSEIHSYPAVTAAAMAVSRTEFLKLGGFDEEYMNGYEDVDFCLRAIETGMKVLYIPDIQIIHSQGSTPGRYTHDADNEHRFLNRWKDKIHQHPEWSLRSLAPCGRSTKDVKSDINYHPEKPQKNIRNFLIITGEPINYPSPVLRLLSPLNALKEKGFLGFSVFQLNHNQNGFRYQLNNIAGINAIIVQRMLPHNWMMEEVFEFIERTNIPLIVETDDLVINRFKPDSAHAQEQTQRDNLFREMVDHSSLVTVPTEVLKTMMEQWIINIPLATCPPTGGLHRGNKRGVGATFPPVSGGKTQRGVVIAVLPNLIDPQIWETQKVSSPIPNGKVRMGFFGSETHGLDLAMITPAIRQVLSSYSGLVELCCWGCITEELKTLDGVRFMGPYDPDYQHYAKRLQNSQVHFSLTPLLPNRFNRAKSPIKYLEFGISGIPGIYSHLEPYHQVVNPPKTGLVVSDNTKDWVEAMSRFIEDDNYRQSIAQNAKQDILNNYLLPQHLDKWEKVLEAF